MPNNEIVELAKKILERSRLKNDILWIEKGSGDQFVAHFESASVQVSRFWDGDIERTFASFCLMNDEGKIIDELLLSQGDQNYNTLDELFERARRTALKADVTYAKLFHILDQPQIQQPTVKGNDDNLPF